VPAEITRRAARAAVDRDIESMRSARDRIAKELDFIESQAPNRRTFSHVKAMRRQLAQLDRALLKP
jgi:hypothetical protein